MSPSFPGTPTSPVSGAREHCESFRFHWDNMRSLWALLLKVIKVSKWIDRNLEGFTSSVTVTDFGASRTVRQF